MGVDDYIKLTQTGVTNFLYCNNHYLFFKRNDTKRVDPGRLNGVGGRLEKGDDFLTATLMDNSQKVTSINKTLLNY